MWQLGDSGHSLQIQGTGVEIGEIAPPPHKRARTSEMQEKNSKAAGGVEETKEEGENSPLCDREREIAHADESGSASLGEEQLEQVNNGAWVSAEDKNRSPYEGGDEEGEVRQRVCYWMCVTYRKIEW